MKKMKIKNLMTFALAMSMCTTAPLVAFADGEEAKTSITIDNAAENSVYSAYRILNVTNEGDKYAYTVDEKYRDTLYEVLSVSTDADVIKKISDMTDEEIRTFADTMYKKLRDAGVATDVTSSDSKFSEVEQGYYLIFESTVGVQPDAYSLIMLDTLGDSDITVTTKEDVPKLTKKVDEYNDSTNQSATLQDAADYDIGDEVPFTLTGTLPNNYANYTTYNYVFHDTLSDGLTLDESSVKVMVGDVDITDKFTLKTGDNADEGDTFTLECDNLKAITEINADSKIIVTYKAVLNNNAVIGSAGNPNTANLEFSNNPYDDGTGETPDDKVTVFSYELLVNKTDKDGNALEGAGFTLYKFDYDTNDYVAVGEEVSGVTSFDYKGLDAGQYKLVETTVPDGYNKADDVVFTIVATYDTDSADPQLKTLGVNDEATSAFTIDVTTGKLTTNVVNVSGTELPETGGIGTTLFYVIGGGCAGIAVVLMITKKRMSKEEE